MESVEAFFKQHLNKEIEGTAKRKDGLGDLIGLSTIRFISQKNTVQGPAVC